MLGLAFNPVNGLLVCDFGAGKWTRSPARRRFSCAPASNPGLNALTFDKNGNVYVSNSFNGVIWNLPWRLATTWQTDPLLGPGTAHSASGPTALSSATTANPFRRQHRVSSDHPDSGDDPEHRRRSVDLHHRHQRPGRDHG